MVLRVTTVFSSALGGLPGYNNLYFNGSGGTDASAVRGNVFDFWSVVAAQMSNSVTCTVLGDVYDINSATGDIESIIGGPSSSVTGALAEQILPPAVQGLIQMNTSTIKNSRRVRGRVFVPGTTEDRSENGRPVTSYRDTVRVAANQLLADSEPQDWVVYSRPTPTVPGSLAEITSVDVWSEWAQMRSRRD